MQLALIFLVACLFGGKSFEQIKAVVEQFGGEEVQTALKQAEEFSSMLSGVLPLSQTNNTPTPPVEENLPKKDNLTPLAPINGIANEQILCALSRYVAMGE